MAHSPSPDLIQINRAPVLTLWAAVVAERLGHTRDEALTFGKAVAVLNAQSKGRRLGIFSPKRNTTADRPGVKAPVREHFVKLIGREVPAVKTRDGLRATLAGETVRPRAVQAYLDRSFGPHLARARSAFEDLARAYSKGALERESAALYERFRPGIPAGVRGWGARGELNLKLVRSLQPKTTRPGDFATRPGDDASAADKPRRRVLRRIGDSLRGTV
jgi:hypothetical protein